jgi:hypothetical protein
MKLVYKNYTVNYANTFIYLFIPRTYNRFKKKFVKNVFIRKLLFN